MEFVAQTNSYRCDKCGTANIVAAPVLYQQGTRAYSGTFNSGTSQSYSAQAVAPPNPRGYARTFLLWGFGIFFASFWGIAGLRAAARYPNSAESSERTVACFAVLALVCVIGMIFNFRRIARYNREVYPQLHWQWEHTYICRRCGQSLLIPS